MMLRIMQHEYNRTLSGEDQWAAGRKGYWGVKRMEACYAYVDRNQTHQTLWKSKEEGGRVQEYNIGRDLFKVHYTHL
jgi:hypothetical protein